MVQNIQKMITIRNLENEKKMIDNNIEFEDPQEEEIIQLVNRTVYLRSIQWVPFTVFIVSFFLTLVFVNIYTGGVSSEIGSPTDTQANVSNISPAGSPSKIGPNDNNVTPKHNRYGSNPNTPLNK
jgi:hypothetical protein